MVYPMQILICIAKISILNTQLDEAIRLIHHTE